MEARSFTLKSALGRTLSFVPSKPDSRIFGKVLDKWWTLYGKNVFDYDNIPLSVNGIAAVAQMSQLSGDRAVYVTRQISQWWFDIMKEICPIGYPDNEIALTLKNLTQGRRAFTNFQGWDEEGGFRRQYWTPDGTNQGQKEDMGLQHVYSSGSTHEIVGERRIAGKDCYAIRAYDASKPETFIGTKYKGSEHMFSIATVNVRANNAEGYNSEMFPRYYNFGTAANGYRDFSRVVVPLLVYGRTELYIPKQLITILPVGSEIPAYPYKR